jgi:hypothetical protein
VGGGNIERISFFFHGGSQLLPAVGRGLAARLLAEGDIFFDM